MWTVAPEPLEQPESQALLRAYFADIVERYHQREIDPKEVEDAMSDDETTGLDAFIVARWDGVPAGCVGLRNHGSVTRMYIAEPYRRRGGGRRLIAALEDAARALGLDRIRLDTREDLVEAQALYLAVGFVEVEPFNDEEFADRFFEKRL